MNVSDEQARARAYLRIEEISGKKKIFVIAVFLCGLMYYLFLSAPRQFPEGEVVHIQKGASSGEIAEILKQENILRSPKTFLAMLYLSGRAKEVIAGDYFFSNSEGAIAVWRRITTGSFGLSPVRVTIPEGTASFDIPKLINGNLPSFDSARFAELAQKKEGYLFPDTYLFYPDITAEGVIQMMTDNFNTKLKSFDGDLRVSGETLNDIIIMASIIEREASRPEDRKLISGILWKRISINMPLQVDAPFAYISNKNTYELTGADLLQASPYNTYKYTGLPSGAIGNPGTDAIEASLHPASSVYMYYLSDRQGNIHYAKTFEEHKKNKKKYVYQ